VFRQLGATVDERIYEQMGHTISPDEIRAVQLLLGRGGMNGRRT
jgi:hypothetical protein